MSLILKAQLRARLREFLARKHENDVTSLISQRHAVGKRISWHDPADIHPERLVYPSAGHIEVFVTQSLDHLEKLAFRSFTRHPADETHNSWHRFGVSD